MSPRIDLTPAEWEIVRTILNKHIPHYEVWAFGSRATGRAKPFSDLDLAVITDKPLDLSVSAEIREAFADSDLPFKVDLVDWATITKTFREIIRRDKVVVQEGQPGHRSS